MTVESATESPRPCPMCGLLDSTPIARATVPGAVTCNGCQFVYLTAAGDRPSKKGVPRVLPSPRYKYLKAVSDRLFHRADVRVLEIGSGTGGLGLCFGADSSYGYRGYEPSHKRAEFCQSMGLDVVSGYFDRSKERSSWYDLVIMDNVLEHVHAPLSLLADATHVLKEGGLLICVVPNRQDVRRLLPKWRRRHYWQNCHVNYFNQSALISAFEAVGLEYRKLPAVPVTRQLMPYAMQNLLDHLPFRMLGLYCLGEKRAVGTSAG